MTTGKAHSQQGISPADGCGEGKDVADVCGICRFRADYIRGETVLGLKADDGQDQDLRENAT